MSDLIGWEGVFIAHLYELGSQATDDQIVENIRPRFSLSVIQEKHIRDNAEQWRAHASKGGMLCTDGSVKGLTK